MRTLALLILLLLLTGCKYDSCNPFDVAQKIRFEREVNGQCVAETYQALNILSKCPNITNLKPKRLSYTDWPTDHLCLTGENNGKPFEVLCD